jgi:hypothetical protein
MMKSMIFSTFAAGLLVLSTAGAGAVPISPLSAQHPAGSAALTRADWDGCDWRCREWRHRHWEHERWEARHRWEHHHDDPYRWRGYDR